MPTPILLDGLQHSWNSYSQTLERLLLAAQGDAWLSAVTVRVHLLVGDHDRVPDVAHLRELAGRHRYLRVSTVNGADHDLPLTHAAAMMAGLKEVVGPFALKWGA